MHEPRLIGVAAKVRADLAALDRARDRLDVPGCDDLLDVRGQGLSQPHSHHSCLSPWGQSSPRAAYSSPAPGCHCVPAR